MNSVSNTQSQQVLFDLRSAPTALSNCLSALPLIPPVKIIDDCTSKLGENIFQTFFSLPFEKYINRIARIDHKLDNIRHYIIKYGKEKNVQNLLNYLNSLSNTEIKAVGHEFLQITSRKTSKNLGIDQYFRLIDLIVSKINFDKYYLKAFYVIHRDLSQILYMFELLKTWQGSHKEDYNESKVEILMSFFLVSIEKLSTQQRLGDIEELFKFIQNEPEIRNVNSNLVLKGLSIYIILMINKRESVSRITAALEYAVSLEMNPSEIFYNKLLDTLTKNFRNDNLHTIILNKMEEKGVEPSLVTYNTMLSITSMTKNFSDCLDIFNIIVEKNLKPDAFSLALLVRSLKQSPSVSKEKITKIIELHTENHIILDTVLCNSIIDVFMILKHSQEALKIFLSMKNDPKLDIDNITFNSLIKGFCRNGMFEEANLIYEEMKQDFPHLLPNRIIFNSLMDASLKEGKLNVAMRLFMEMQQFEISPDSFSYSILLNGLKQAKASERIILKTLLSIKQILDISDFKLDEIFFNCILDTCSKYEIFTMMDYFYKIMKMKKIPESDITFGILIKAYGKMGNFEKAEQLFNEMMGSNLRINNITFGCVLDACAKNGKMEEALKIFFKLKENNLHMNSVVFTTIIKGFINAERYHEAVTFFLEVKDFTDLDGMLITYNCSLDAYVRLGQLNEAVALFNDIESKFGADLVSYSTLLKVFIQNEMKEKAFLYFTRLLNSEIKADISIVNLFLDSCASRTDFKLALKIYEQADLHRIRPNEVTFGIMIKVYGFSREVTKAFDLIPVMKAYNIDPSIIVFTNLVHISFYNKKYKKVTEAFTMLKKDKLKGDKLLYSKLIDGFLKAKAYNTAIKYFKFAYNERCPLKPEIAEKLSKIIPATDPNQVKIIEMKDFSEYKIPRKVFGESKVRQPRPIGKKDLYKTPGKFPIINKGGVWKGSNKIARGFYKSGNTIQNRKLSDNKDQSDTNTNTSTYNNIGTKTSTYNNDNKPK